MSALKKLTAITLPQEVVAVPELGEDAEIIIRQMSVGDMLEFESLCFDDQGKSSMPFNEFMMTLLICTMVDEDGNPIASMGERDVLMDSLSGTVAMRLFKAASRLNGLTAGGTDDIKKS
ncbi:hypothetical protein PQY08_002660 [Salmonella enterica]|nr:hypothetical protein [Salmonella enterica]EBL8181129.1 hypothetical protein [Salmonella enterica]EJG3779916.1 hypothetical protein [Salmonella enterica]EJM0401727.1 hypothetical protein [Salmonella enterica]EKH2729786.1 hypothetical protein [Salmonella enterica]